MKHIPFIRKRGRRRDDDVGEEEDATPVPADLEDRSTEFGNARRPPATLSGRSNNTSANFLARQIAGRRRHGSDAVRTHGQDPLGLKVVYRPELEPHVDIVFVHGLGGSSRATWSKDRDLRYFWPLQFLRHEPVIKDEARILTFGYNANFRPGSGKNKMTILDFAKELLFELKYAQDETAELPEDLGRGQRPIIFVVHSMGGLIVKEAYMQGQIDPTFSNIVKSVSAIIFLSTPHRGTNLAETLNRILQVSFVASPMQFIAELATGSQTLQKLNEQFRHIAPKLDIVSFYETRPTSMFKKSQIMVLEKDSSVLGYPGEISRPLDADHHGVCKYESRDDPNYIAVRNVLKTLVSNAKPKDLWGTIINETWLAGLERLLGVSQSPETDYNFFRDRWTAGTCTWIENDPNFVEWIQDGQVTPRVLWIQGNAACGKSILSSFVIDYLVQSHRICHYFFVRFEDEKKRSLSTLLRSLACQLARSLPAYAARIRQLEAASTDLKSSDYRHVWQMMYKQGLFDLEFHNPIYWVLDGVDEADNPQLLLNVLSELRDVAIPVRILLVSRQTHEISTAAEKFGKQLDVRQISIEGNKEDFRKYIDREMDSVGEDSYMEELKGMILQLSQGNFLWVHLAVQKINQCHTRMEVQDALKELPSGMEALYHRMARNIKTQPSGKDPTLGQSILIWATYAQRPLNIDELSDALGIDGLLEIQRTIGQLCGGFVVMDHEGRVALIHETAKEYLIRGEDDGPSLGLEKRISNDKLSKRCLSRLMDPTLRNLVNRDRTPALLDYAASALFFHLTHGSCMNREKLSDLLKFFESQHVLTWIHVVAKAKKLRSLVVASRYLNEIVSKLRHMPDDEESQLHRRAIDSLTAWAVDLVELVGKFGAFLIKRPDAIYKLVPPFCPEDSIVYQQFGKNEAKALRVCGVTRTSWDDCLARLSLEQGVMGSAVLHAGGRIVVLANRQNSGYIYIYNSTTFEEERRILHPERVFKIQTDSVGENVVSYGFRTTRVWSMANGQCIKTVDNPRKRPRPQSIVYLDKTRKVLVAGEDRCVRSFKVDDESTEWETVVKITEQSQEETYTVLNAPICSALSPDGDLIAFGYRGHPVTVWDLGTEDQIGQCNMTPNETGMTTQTRTLGEITCLKWHPFNGEVFGLHREGLLFKWNPYDDEASATVHARAHFLAVSKDGALVATGDAEGTLKIYTAADLTLLYQLSSQNHVLHIAFSVDSKRLYDLRGDYGNVWEPNALVRLAESSEFTDQNSDSWSETGSMAKLTPQTEQHFPGVDTITSLCGQAAGPLYCFGTENGVAILGEVGQGSVCEIERMANFMSFEHTAWSDDGKILAISDLSGRIFVKRISRETSSQEHPSWRAHNEFKFAFPTTLRYLSHLMFQPKTHILLAVSAVGLVKINTETQEVEEAIFMNEMTNVRWISHPTRPVYLLAFGSINVHIFSWSTLKELAVYPYFPPRLAHATATSETSHGRGSFRAAEEKVGKILSCANLPDVILQIITPPSDPGLPETQYLMFTLSNLDGALTGDSSKQPNGLSCTSVPPEIASRIREPLALLPRGRLAFFDTDRWICTWRMPNAPRRSVGNDGRSGSEAGLVGPVDAHYFLPGDWVTATEARLCTVAPDGTLLCPRNGDVASVQCAKLRK